jgi:hypothetical protein
VALSPRRRARRPTSSAAEPAIRSHRSAGSGRRSHSGCGPTRRIEQRPEALCQRPQARRRCRARRRAVSERSCVIAPYAPSSLISV